VDRERTLCVICSQPTESTAYACTACADGTCARLRTIADLADAARDAAHGLVRYGTGGRRTDVDAPIPGNLAAAAVLDECVATLTTWARHVMQERAVVQLPAGDPLVISARYLDAHVEWLRHQPYADEVFDEVRDVERRITRLADRPPELVIVGVCECGTWVYGRQGAAVVQCRDRTCGRRWDAAKSRDILRRAMDDQVLTAAQIATLAARAGHDRGRVRHLVTVWASRGVIVRTSRDGQGYPCYRLGDVMARLPTLAASGVG